MSDLDLKNKIKYTVMKGPAGKKISESTPGQRIRDAAIGALALGGLGMLLRKGVQLKIKANPKAFSKGMGSLIKRHYGNPFAPMGISSDLAVGTVAGFKNRDLRNAIIRASQGGDMAELKKDLDEDLAATKNIALPYINKSAGIVGGAIKGATTLGKTIGYGFLPMGKGRLGQWGARVAGRSSFPLSHRAFGLGVKGGAAYGLYRGGKAIYRKTHDDPRSGEYTTFLRNNLLAGNIQPGELSHPDMESVRQLGMK